MTYDVGIDLGTTYSAAAVHRDGRSSIFPLGSRAAAIPTVVYLKEGGQVLTGEAAVRRAITEPERVAREFKRRLGDTTPVIVGGTPYSAEALMARVLRGVLDEVERREGSPPSRIAISHPANWGQYKLDLLNQAIRLAEIDAEKVTLLTEPEAAALSYASQERIDQGEIIAVYDLGGGTFDAAVLRRTEDGFEIIGKPEGIERLGGIDFDAAVAAHVARSLDGALDEIDHDDPASIAGMSRLRQDCVDAKEALSSDTDATIPVLLPTVQTEVRITRAEFEALIRPSLVDSIGAMHRAVKSAGVAWEDISKVLLVGGSSRVPLISQMVSSELGRPVAIDAHPKHAVALGAAFAASEEGVATDAEPAKPGVEILDVAPSSAVAAPVSPAEAEAPPAPAPAPTPVAPTTVEPTTAAAMPAAQATPAPTSPADPASTTSAAPSAPAAPRRPAPAAPLDPPRFNETPSADPLPAAASRPDPTASSETSGRASAPPPSTPVTPASVGTAPESDGGLGSRLPLIGAIVAVLVLVAIGAFVVLNSGGDGDTATETTIDGGSGDTEPEGDDTTTTEADATTTTEGATTTVAPPGADEVAAAVADVVDENFSTVEASITGDTVTLTGRAFDETERDAALAAAEAIPGVASVDDQTEVQTEDEQCTENVRAQPNWACITSASFDGTTVTGTYYSSVDEGGPDFNINGGLHLHVYASTFDPVAVGAAGPFSDGTGDWQVWDTPQIIEVSLGQLGVAEVPEKLCALIANQVHTIESPNSGTCWPIELAEG